MAPFLIALFTALASLKMGRGENVSGIDADTDGGCWVNGSRLMDGDLDENGVFTLGDASMLGSILAGNASFPWKYDGSSDDEAAGRKNGCYACGLKLVDGDFNGDGKADTLDSEVLSYIANGTEQFPWQSADCSVPPQPTPAPTNDALVSGASSNTCWMVTFATWVMPLTWTLKTFLVSA